jgi:FdhD protein
MRSGPQAGVAWRPVVRAGAAATAVTTPELDEVAVEEPLEIRVAGDALAVTMRSPGADRELALGFLHAEGVIRSIEDVGTVAHCGHPGEPGFGNVIDVLPGPGVVLAPERIVGTRRGTLTSSACGVCGRLSIDDLTARCAPVRDACRIGAADLSSLGRALRQHQPLFARTGGVHAAALHDLTGGPPIVHEDVGRHNAVDKVVGALLLARGLPATGKLLLVSGRASFEIVQKAAVAGIAVVASVSAPSTLAIDLAARMNVTLVAFLRDGAMNVYTARERITGTAG